MKVTKNVAVSGLGCRKVLVGTGRVQRGTSCLTLWGLHFQLSRLVLSYTRLAFPESLDWKLVNW